MGQQIKPSPADPMVTRDTPDAIHPVHHVAALHDFPSQLDNVVRVSVARQRFGGQVCQVPDLDTLRPRPTYQLVEMLEHFTSQLLVRSELEVVITVNDSIQTVAVDQTIQSTGAHLSVEGAHQIRAPHQLFGQPNVLSHGGEGRPASLRHRTNTVSTDRPRVLGVLEGIEFAE